MLTACERTLLMATGDRRRPVLYPRGRKGVLSLLTCLPGRAACYYGRKRYCWLELLMLLRWRPGQPINIVVGDTAISTLAAWR